MGIESSPTKYFIRNGVRYKTLSEAKSVIDSENPDLRFILSKVVNDNQSKSRHIYVVEKEPAVQRLPTYTSICGAGQIVTMVGSVSGVTDDILNFEWTQTEGTLVVLSGANTKTAQFVRSGSDDLVFRFTVTNARTGVVNHKFYKINGSPIEDLHIDAGGAYLSDWLHKHVYDATVDIVLPNGMSPSSGTGAVANHNIRVRKPQLDEQDFAGHTLTRVSVEYNSGNGFVQSGVIPISEVLYYPITDSSFYRVKYEWTRAGKKYFHTGNVIRYKSVDAGLISLVATDTFRYSAMSGRDGIDYTSVYRLGSIARSGEDVYGGSIGGGSPTTSSSPELRLLGLQRDSLSQTQMGIYFINGVNSSNTQTTIIRQTGV